MNLDRRPDNHEAAMARADLYKLANYSMKLFKMIQEGQELEGWVQAKITKAADYVASVYHFMEYEMKSSEYGEKLENSDVYSESVRRAFEQKLMEAKRQAEKIKKSADKVEEGFDEMEKYLKDKKGPQPSGGAGKKQGSKYGGSKQAADKEDDEDESKKKDKKVKESAKPDYLDFDKDGNKKEPMKKALKDKKIKEGGYYDPSNDMPQGQNPGAPLKGSQASMDKLKQAMAASGTSGQNNPNSLAAVNPTLAKKYPPGSLTDDRAKQFWLNAIAAGQIPSGSKFVPSDWGGGAAGNSGVKESRKGVDKLPDPPDEVHLSKKGSKHGPVDVYKKKTNEGSGCNQTMEGKSCPVHGLKECPMEESVKKGLYYNVNKRKKAGTSRDKDHPKAPSAQDWKNAAKTAKK